MSDVSRVLLAEPDAPTRAGIRLALEADGFEICSEPLDASAAIDDALRDRPDVCLIDENLRGGAIVAVDAIYRRLPDTKLVMLTDRDEPKSLLAGIRAGASGYRAHRPRSRPPDGDDPRGAGRRGRDLAAPDVSPARSLRTRERGRSAPTTPGGPSMTDRELEVLELMAEGLRTSEIAPHLSIAEATVRRHVSSAVASSGSPTGPRRSAC